MGIIDKLQLQKILEKKRMSQASAPKMTLAETEKLIAAREIIADVVNEFDQIKTKIENITNRPISDADIRAYYDAMEFERQFEENQKKIAAAKPQKKPDDDFLMLKNAFEPEKETMNKDADFLMLEAAFAEDNK